ATRTGGSWTFRQGSDGSARWRATVTARLSRSLNDAGAGGSGAEGPMDRTLTLTFQPVTCANCRVAFALEEDYRKDRLRDHRTFYCPNGHSNYYPGRSDLEQLK